MTASACDGRPEGGLTGSQIGEEASWTISVSAIISHLDDFLRYLKQNIHSSLRNLPTILTLAKPHYSNEWAWNESLCRSKFDPSKVDRQRTLRKEI